ncbi:T9SS type A sorting domain-containing protein [Mesonia aquimarina]|uniref:T9SS type A sorting domain-containing protein n=1 Tax=Mesonia aquimarina TaxID=1504967 RepID=UPI000EF593DE|nr:T9SS type A sorting domain-containing protein [Mesonia aquimarina]
MKTFIKILSFLCSLTVLAQTTSIPDQQFEQILINEGIDSDGTINGQVLTSDINSVQNLELNDVADLTGLEDFNALESLVLDEGGGLDSQGWPDVIIDLTANTNLKELEIWGFMKLNVLDVTGLTQLKELRLGNISDDLQEMSISELDLSTNINIEYVEIGFVDPLNYVNLKNGNNINMQNFALNIDHYGPISTCIKVDDATKATNNTAPYNTWLLSGVDPNFYENGECNLSLKQAEVIEVTLHPNPTENTFQLQTQAEVQKVELFSLQGKKLAQFSSQENYDISFLQTGIYFVKVSTTKESQTLRLIKK